MSARAERPSGSRGRSAESVRDDEPVGPLRLDVEPLALGGLAEASVEAHEVLTGGASVRPEKSGSESESVGSAKRMEEKDARSRFSDLVARLHLGPTRGETRH